MDESALARTKKEAPDTRARAGAPPAGRHHPSRQQHEKTPGEVLNAAISAGRRGLLN
jgi:hypothetical protein